MSIRQYYLSLAGVLLGILMLGILWEFVAEEIVQFIFYEGREIETESDEERWEYVKTIAFFSFLGVIIPSIIARKLIREKQQLTESNFPA